MVRALACHARGRGFEPHPSRHSFHKNILNADLAHLVERHLAKVEVAGSSPVIRSKGCIVDRRCIFHFKADKGRLHPPRVRVLSSRIVAICRTLSPSLAPCFVDFRRLKQYSTVLTSSPVIRSKGCIVDRRCIFLLRRTRGVFTRRGFEFCQVA